MLHVVPDVWGTLLERGLRFVQRRCTRNSMKEQDPICAWINGIVPTPARRRLSSTQAVIGQVHPNSPGTGSRYKNTEPGCILTILRVPFMVCPLRSADAKTARLFKRFRTAGTNGRINLSLTWRVSEDPPKRPYKIGSGSKNLR